MSKKIKEMMKYKEKLKGKTHEEANMLLFILKKTIWNRRKKIKIQK